jgi:hypothetical protein
MLAAVAHGCLWTAIVPGNRSVEVLVGAGDLMTNCPKFEPQLTKAQPSHSTATHWLARPVAHLRCLPRSAAAEVLRGKFRAGKLLYFRQMASITLSLPDDLASQIRAQQQQLPRILELGLRELNAGGQSGFDGAADVLELFAALPAPEEILKLRPSTRLSARVAELVEKSRAGEMTPLDEEEWERYEYLEHLVRMAKAAAQLKLAPSAGDA